MEKGKLTPGWSEQASIVEMPWRTNKTVIALADYCNNHGNLDPLTLLNNLSNPEYEHPFPKDLPADKEEKNQAINAWIVKTAFSLSQTDGRRTAAKNDWMARAEQETETRMHAEDTLKMLAHLNIVADPDKVADFEERIRYYADFRERHPDKRLRRSARNELMGPEESLWRYLGRQALGS